MDDVRRVPRARRMFAGALVVAAVLLSGCSADARPVPPALPGGAGSPAARPSVVSLTFDDASPSQYLVRPILLDHGLRATFFVNSGFIDRADGSTMTWDQVRALAADGNDIGGHTRTHAVLPELTVADRQREICDDRARLESQGLRVVSFAYPTAAVDPRTEALVRSCGYLSGRVVGNVAVEEGIRAEPLPPRDPFATDALGPPAVGPLDTAYLRRAIETAAASGGGWLQIVLHRVCRPSSVDYGPCMASEGPIDIGAFSDFVDWLTHRAPPGTVVAPVDEVVARD